MQGGRDEDISAAPLPHLRYLAPVAGWRLQ